jgi:hypothetical protein
MRRPKHVAKKMRAHDRAAEKRRAEHAAFFARPALPCVVLSVDPGLRAGATIIAPDPSSWAPAIALSGPVDSMSREPEAVIRTAITIAQTRRMRLYLVTEEWGRGGPLGIDQWLGLGERRGIWKREFRLIGAETEDSPIRGDSSFHVNARTWRSRMIFETGERVSGTFRPFDTDGWKRAATRSLLALAPDSVIESADAAESALQGLYAIRSDELRKKLGPRYLKQWGVT